MSACVAAHCGICIVLNDAGSPQFAAREGSENFS